MTLEMSSRPSTASGATRLAPRSSIAVADVELARQTVVELAEPTALEEAGERMLARLRRLVIRDPDAGDARG